MKLIKRKSKLILELNKHFKLIIHQYNRTKGIENYIENLVNSGMKYIDIYNKLVVRNDLILETVKEGV